jgi:hypothetical protein
LEAPPPSFPQVPTWAEIYPSITGYPSVLQALLAPAATPEKYYQKLVAAAREVGLSDPQVLLGILWHAPLGDGGRSPERWEYFQRLVGTGEKQEGRFTEGGPSRTRDAPPPPDMGNTTRIPETGSADVAGGQWPPVAGYPSAPPETPAAGSQSRQDRTPSADGSGLLKRPAEEDYFDSWTELVRLGRETLLVDRRRYEAMIYELGKLGAWQDFLKGQQRENRHLREKIEAQWNRELEFFRELSSKNGKKGWRVW